MDINGVDTNSDHLRMTVFPVTLSNCLSHHPIAVKSHQEQDNTGKRKHLAGGWLTISEGQSVLITVKAWCTGQHGPGAESLHCELQAAQRHEACLGILTSKAHPQ